MPVQTPEVCAPNGHYKPYRKNPKLIGIEIEVLLEYRSLKATVVDGEVAKNTWMLQVLCAVEGNVSTSDRYHIMAVLHSNLMLRIIPRAEAARGPCILLESFKNGEEISIIKRCSILGMIASQMSVERLGRLRPSTLVKPIAVVVLEDTTALRSYQQLSHQIDMAHYHWAFFTDIEPEAFANFSIPYDCKFLLINGSPDSVGLKELYKFTPRSRMEVNEFGKWSAAAGLTLPSLGFYGRRLDFKGTELDYLSNKPDLCADVSVAEGLAIPCIHVKVWTLIIETLNATTKPVPFLSRFPENLETEFAAGRAESAVAAIYMASHARKHVDFLWPIFDVRLEVYTQYGGMEVTWSSYLRPFSPLIWYAVVAWVVLCCSIFAFTRKLAVDCLPADDFRAEQIWSPLYAFLGQGTTEPANKISMRLLLTAAFLAPAVLIPAYNASLTSFLAIRYPEMPFTSLEEMKDAPKYRLSGIRSFGIDEVFEKGDDETSRYIFNQAMLPAEKRPVTSIEGFRRMCSETFSFIETEYSATALKPKCKFFKLRKPIASYPVSMTIPKNSRYSHAFDIVMKRMRFTGVLLQLKYSVTKAQIVGLFLKDVIEDDELSIHVENVALLLSAFAMAACLSLIILCLEMIVGRASKKNHGAQIYPFLH